MNAALVETLHVGHDMLHTSCLSGGSPHSLFLMSLYNSSKGTKLPVFDLYNAELSGTPRFIESIKLLHISIGTSPYKQYMYIQVLLSKAEHTNITVM